MTVDWCSWHGYCCYCCKPVHWNCVHAQEWTTVCQDHCPQRPGFLTHFLGYCWGLIFLPRPLKLSCLLSPVQNGQRAVLCFPQFLLLLDCVRVHMACERKIHMQLIRTFFGGTIHYVSSICHSVKKRIKILYLHFKKWISRCELHANFNLQLNTCKQLNINTM